VDLGVVWNPKTTWDEMFATLEAYKRDHKGNVNVPASYVTADGKALGTWLDNQRKAYRNNKLADDRIKRLGDLGVTWKPKTTACDDQRERERERV